MANENENNNLLSEVEKLANELGIDRKRSIGEVAKELGVKTHVIRFWEENFPQIQPEIGAGNRRYYYNKQLQILKKIKEFLYDDGYTIAGLKKMLKKRNQEKDVDENLDLILSQVPRRKRELNPPSKERIELEDFIDEKQLKGRSIDPNLKLRDLSSVRISAIDVNIQHEVLQAVQNIRLNIGKLEALGVDLASDDE